MPPSPRAQAQHDKLPDFEDQSHASPSIMGREINIESIRVLERQIEESNGDAIELKRARNSLLNISTLVPPEILGDIFSWTLIRGTAFSYHAPRYDGFCKGSYNFLLVCHHWFEVASHIPKLWSFWGNTLRQWKEGQRHHPRLAPLDLVLNGNMGGTDASTDDTLRDALRDRASRDTIRQVHLLWHRQGLLSSIISLLTPDGDEPQCRSIESIDLRSLGDSVLVVSNFFSRAYFPKLRSLVLHGALTLPPWDHIAQRTTLLTVLLLDIDNPSPSPTPTTRELFSILASNPGLQLLSLSGSALPEDGGDGFTPPVSLRRLQKIYLTGELHRIFGVLERLSFPRPLARIEVTAIDSMAEDISRTVGPYLKHYFQQDHKPQDTLSLTAYSLPNRLSICVRTEVKARNSVPFFAKFRVCLAPNAPRGFLANLCHDFASFTPQERVYSLDTNLSSTQMEDLLLAMPNIETLRLFNVVLSKGFLRPNPDGPHAKTNLLPSLRSLYLEDVVLINDSWRPLKEYLVHLASDGQAIYLNLEGGSPHICREVAKELEGLVEDFSCPVYQLTCSMAICGG
ncbi:hypothetical protein BJ322DRAFT_1110410 [Thelephora terrestris]|uniref:F-box domain-containing protein n=1 Tax=Thelephora terrestris TaxID=56493 RepID=A0A9P6HBF8_9AGAM|nr:hypothetical protein BJ322DRAFT_1110410 [Thelephora terrestris]